MSDAVVFVFVLCMRVYVFMCVCKCVCKCEYVCMCYDTHEPNQLNKSCIKKSSKKDDKESNCILYT